MPQVTPFDNILAQSRDLFCERLATALAGMLDKADNALTALESEVRDVDAQALYRETRDKVLAQREKIETQFRVRYLREFQLRSNRSKKIGDDFSDIDLSDVELALVGEDDLNETLKFNAMTARLRQYCEEELAALDQRVGVLFGDAGLQPDDNPFAPQAISDAYKQTCAQVEDDVEVRLVLLKLFDEFVLDEIRGIYRAVNVLLVQNAILPKLRGMGAPKRERIKPRPPETKGPEQDFFMLLQNLVAQRPAGIAQPVSAPAATPVPAMPTMPGTLPADGLPGAVAGTGGVRQVVEGAELQRSLTRVQLGDATAVAADVGPLIAGIAEPGTTNVLRELKATSLGGGMSQMDAMTLDIVALLFDQLFDDSKIPIGVKGLIGRLQIPFLKVAIADKAFFSRTAHPARHMLDTLGEVAARLPADVNASNPTFARLDAMLQGLMKRFEENIEIFDTVREQMEALVIEEDQRIEEQAQADEKQVEQKESLALAKTVAQTEIKMRLRAARLPRAVVEFLLRQWIKVLLLVQVKEGEDSDAWKRVLETMDLLVWSVEPKDTREARRELVGKVPDLLRRLADALAAAGIEDAVCARFVADLRKLHSEIIAGNAGALAAAPEQPAPALEFPAVELAPAIKPEPAIPSKPVEPAPAFELPVIHFAPAAEAAPAVPAAPAMSAEPPMAFALPKIGKTPAAPAKPHTPAPSLESPPRPKQQVSVKPAMPPAPVAAKPAEPESPDMTAPVTVPNPFGEGEVEVADLDFTVQSRGGTSGAKATSALPPALKLGSWVEIVRKHEKEKHQTAKLTFISPLKTRYLFADRQGKTALECSQTDLVRRFQLGEVIISKEPTELPLFDRLAEGVADKLGQRR